jgi:hypothetical protein
MTEQPPVETIPPPKQSLIKRIGCGILVVMWFILILTPACFLMLAMQGEIALWHGGNFPENEAHPLFQVKLLMDADTRGLNITTSSLVDGPDNQVCVQVYVRYMLWQGRGENTSYCDCYTHEETDWDFTGSSRGVCTANE